MGALKILSLQKEGIQLGQVLASDVRDEAEILFRYTQLQTPLYILSRICESRYKSRYSERFFKTNV